MKIKIHNLSEANTVVFTKDSDFKEFICFPPNWEGEAYLDEEENVVIFPKLGVIPAKNVAEKEGIIYIKPTDATAYAVSDI